MTYRKTFLARRDARDARDERDDASGRSGDVEEGDGTVGGDGGEFVAVWAETNAPDGVGVVRHGLREERSQSFTVESEEPVTRAAPSGEAVRDKTQLL